MSLICKSCGPLIDCLCSNGEVTSQSPKPSGPNPRPTGPGASVLGTPKTLLGAIENGTSDCPYPSPHSLPRIMEMHVRDFLAQKFGVAICMTTDEKSIADLWKAITGKELKL